MLVGREKGGADKFHLLCISKQIHLFLTNGWIKTLFWNTVALHMCTFLDFVVYNNVYSIVMCGPKCVYLAKSHTKCAYWGSCVQNAYEGWARNEWWYWKVTDSSSSWTKLIDALIKVNLT